MENKKFSVELGEMFNAIADKIATATDSGYKAINERFEKIKNLRKEIDEEYVELKAIGVAVNTFANTISKNNATHNEEATETEEALDILDELDDCFLHEIGTCAYCGRVIMSNEEDNVVVGQDGKLYCDSQCYEDSMIIGTCDYCGETFCEGDDWVENEHGFFCCESCAEKYANEQEVEEDIDEDEVENTDNE